MQNFQPVDQIQPPPLDPPLDPQSAQVLDYGTVRPARKSRGNLLPREPLWPAVGWLRHIMACMGLASVVLMAFSNSYKSGMTLDNKYIIEEYYKSVVKGQQNIDLQSWQEVGLLFQNDYWWPKGISGLYRPITTLTYWFDYVVLAHRPYKTDAAGEIVRDAYGQPVLMSWLEYALTPGRKLDTTSYHTINLTVHWLNGVLLYFVALLLTKRYWPSVMIAALFLAHPITTESVTNIIGRADMFAGIAVFGGLLLYVRSMRNSDSWALPWLIGLMLLVTFGVFSKESSAAVVLVAICYDVVHHWRTGEDGKNGLALLVGRSLLYAMVMILVPMMTSSWSETVLHPARFPMVVRVGLAVVIVGYGLAQYVLLGFLRETREPLLFLGGVLVSTIFATVVMPFYPLVLPIAVGLIELTRLWVKLVREDRFGELPRLIGHGLLYLTLAGVLIGAPLAFSYLATDSRALAKVPHLLGGIIDHLANMSPVARYVFAALVTGAGIAGYGALYQSDRLIRAASLLVLAGAASMAAIALPYIPLTVTIAVLAIELSRGSLTSASDRFRVVAHATIYFFLFFILIGLPVAALIQFHRWGLDEWFTGYEEYVKQLSTRIPQWRWYLQGSLAMAAGLFLHFATIRRDRTTRAVALIAILITMVMASFSSYFMGILLGIIVAIHEVILGTLLPEGADYRRDWKRIWHGFALGYIVMIPPLLAMLLVRMWIFSNATPAEEPFLDNPIRGIWKVQDLGIKAFEEELAKKPLEGMTFPECKMTAVKVLGKCIYLVAWPWTLCSDYSYDEFPNFSWYLYRWEDWKAVFSLCFFIGCGYAAYMLRDKSRAACFFILCFFAAALPTSNLTITIGSVMAERFMYLPLGAFAGVVVLLVYQLAKMLLEKLRGDETTRGLVLFAILSSLALIAVCVAAIRWGGNLYITFGCVLGTVIVISMAGLYLITLDPKNDPSAPAMPVRVPWLQTSVVVFLAGWMVVYGVRAYDRNFVWENDLALWKDAIKTSTRSFRCYQSLAFAKYEEDARKNIDEMIKIDEEGVPIVDHLPNHLNSSRLYLHLGMFYVLKGDFLSSPSKEGPIITPEAAVYFDKARAILEKGAQVDRAFNELNYTKQIQRGDKPETIANAGLGPVYTTLAMAYSRLDRPDISAQRLLYARQLDPTDFEVYEKYGSIKFQQKQWEDAAMSMIQSIVMGPPENPRPWEYLPKIFAQMGPEWQDAVSMQGQLTRMNFKSPMLQRLITRVFRDLMSGFLRAKRPMMATQIREMALRPLNHYDWITADALDGVFDEPVPEVDPDGIHMDRAVPGQGRPGKKRPTTSP